MISALAFAKENDEKNDKDKDNDKKDDKKKADEKDDEDEGKEKKGTKPKPKLKDFSLIIAPIRASDAQRSPLSPDSIEPIHPIAGKPFAVFVAVVDANNQAVQSDGQFQFHWSDHNYVNPEKPKLRAKPEGIDGWFDLRDGVAVIHNVRFDAIGQIKLTGMARIRVAIDNPGQSKKKDDDGDDDGKGKTQVIIDEGEPFVVQPAGFRAILLNDGQPYSGSMAAGESFTLKIEAVNHLGAIIENYPYDDRFDSIERDLNIRLKWLEPDGADSGELRGRSGNAIDVIPASAFSDGVAFLPHVSCSDVGVLAMRIVDPDYMGLRVVGSWSRLAKFVPHHFDLEIAQPSVSGGLDARYNYSGQPFEATVAVSAKNAHSPPETTRNYFGALSRFDENAFSISLHLSDRHLGSLVYSSTQTPFQSGVSMVSVTQMAFAFSSRSNPQSLRLLYRFAAKDGRAGEALGPRTEFRSGRIRTRQNQGMVGDYLEARIEIEHYFDSQWELNRDEERLAVSIDDLELAGQRPAGAIMGATRTVFAGCIRGGTDPFYIQTQPINAPNRFSVRLKETSPLRFLDSVEEPWRVFPASSSPATQGMAWRSRARSEN